MIRLCVSMSNIKRVKLNNPLDIVFMKSRADIWAAFVILGLLKMKDCIFCRIANGVEHAAVICETSELMVFADHNPIRESHVQIIPKDHIVCFEDLPKSLVGQIMFIGQKIAKAQKQIYGIERVGFIFSGHDVAHCHAHVVPLHDKDDITSRRFFASGDVRYAKRKFLAPFELAQAFEKLRHALLHS